MYVYVRLLALVGASLATFVAAKDESKIAVFGSSVASGCCQGSANSPVSYANQLTNYQRDYAGRTVINVSKGGGNFCVLVGGQFLFVCFIRSQTANRPQKLKDLSLSLMRA